MSPEQNLLTLKLLNAGLSVAGFSLGVAILFFGRPGLTVRTAIVAGSALTLVCSILLGGDLFSTVLVEDRFTALRRLGWFALGLLFGAGRGDRIVNWIRPPQIPVFNSEPIFKVDPGTDVGPGHDTENSDEKPGSLIQPDNSDAK